jgi:adenylate kinase
MPDIIVLMGPQGAGKGTQARMLAEKLSLPIIATGDILREVARADTDLGHVVRDTQAAGRLVSDEILAKIVSRRIAEGDCEQGCILDGFPRTLPQAKLLDSISAGQGSRIIVIDIDVPRDLLKKRLTGRRMCPVCGSIYNIYFKPPAKEGICDLDGGALVIRSDDTEEAIEKRLAQYDEKTRPLLAYYRERGSLFTVDGTDHPEQVSANIAGIIERLSAPAGAV